MSVNGANRRRAARFPCLVETAVELNANGEKTAATAINQSVSGVYLQFKGPVDLAVGDRVTCEFSFQPHAGVVLPNWGMGNVVRVDGSNAAIQLSAGSFIPVPWPLGEDDPDSPDANDPDAS